MMPDHRGSQAFGCSRDPFAPSHASSLLVESPKVEKGGRTGIIRPAPLRDRSADVQPLSHRSFRRAARQDDLPTTSGGACSANQRHDLGRINALVRDGA